MGYQESLQISLSEPVPVNPTVSPVTGIINILMYHIFHIIIMFCSTSSFIPLIIFVFMKHLHCYYIIATLFFVFVFNKNFVGLNKAHENNKTDNASCKYLKNKNSSSLMFTNTYLNKLKQIIHHFIVFINY